jgi:predicted dehydrogenase
MMNVAVLGLGWWGPKLLRNFLSHPAVGRVIGVDPSEARRGEMRETFAIETRAHVGSVLADPDIGAVVVATPVPTHFDLVKSAFEAGKDVLLTKPPTRTLDELERLVEIASARGRIFMMDSTFVYSTPVQKIGELLRTGLFEEIRYVQSLRYGNDLRMHDVNRLRETMFDNGVSVIDDLLFHDMAILSYLFADFASRPRSVQRVHMLSRDLCDTAFIHLETKEFPVHIALSWTLPERRRELVIADDKKQLVFDDLKDDGKIEIFWIEEQRREQVPCGAEEPLFRVVDHFAECVENRREPFTNGPYMMKVMRDLRAVQEAI